MSFLPRLARLVSRRLSSSLALTLALASLAVAGVTQAEPLDDASRAAAITLGESGLDAFDAGRFREAYEKLDKAYGIARVPTLGLWSGRALEKLGRWVEALARYQEAVSLPVPADEDERQVQGRVEASAEIAALKRRIPSVSIEIEGVAAGAVALSIDGHPLTAAAGPKYPLDPGRHRVRADRGTTSKEQEVVLAAGESKHIVLPFEPGSGGGVTLSASQAAEATPSSGAWSLRTWGWVSLGAGGAGLLLGSIGGIGALNKKAEIDDNPNCTKNKCAPSESELVDSYDSWRAVSSVGFIAGGLFAATGVVLLTLAPPEGGGDAGAEAFIGPGSIGARGHF